MLHQATERGPGRLHLPRLDGGAGKRWRGHRRALAPRTRQSLAPIVSLSVLFRAALFAMRNILLVFSGGSTKFGTDPLRLRLNEKAFPWFPLGLRFSLFTSDVKVHLHPDKTGTNQSEVDIVDSGSRDEGSFCLWTVDPLFSVGCPRSKMAGFCLVSLQTPTPVVL